jgi:hypothetical protein
MSIEAIPGERALRHALELKACRGDHVGNSGFRRCGGIARKILDPDHTFVITVNTKGPGILDPALTSLERRGVSSSYFLWN